MTPEPLPPPWAKPGGHEDSPNFTVVTIHGGHLFPSTRPITADDEPTADGWNGGGDLDARPSGSGP